MQVCKVLENKLNENGSYAETLREKILYCIGFLEDDDENEDLYNLLTYMLYSEKDYPENTLVSKNPVCTITPTSNFKFPTFTTKFSKKCKTCKHYKDDVLLGCTGCKYFTSSDIYPDLYEENENATIKK